MNGTTLEQNIFWNHTCMFIHMQFEMIFCFKNIKVSNWKGFKECFVKSHSDKISYLTQKNILCQCGSYGWRNTFKCATKQFWYGPLDYSVITSNRFSLERRKCFDLFIIYPRPDIWPRSAFLHEAWLSSNHFKTVKTFLRSMFRHP